MALTGVAVICGLVESVIFFFCTHSLIARCDQFSCVEMRFVGIQIGETILIPNIIDRFATQSNIGESRQRETRSDHRCFLLGCASELTNACSPMVFWFGWFF